MNTHEGQGSHAPMAPLALPGARGGRLWRLTHGEGRQYAPYFYNPHLDAAGRRLLFLWNRGGVEQAYVLNREAQEAVQLTDARGRDQHWSPYIRRGVDGVRPQFVCWSQPDWQHVLFFEGSRLCRVHVETLHTDVLCEVPAGRVPVVPHCSAAGLVAWGYLTAALQQRLRESPALGTLLRDDPAFRAEIGSGACGFMVFDLRSGRLALDVSTPFWPNHVQSSPDGRWVLFCQEGPWQAQRMHLYDVARGTWRPLRPQDGGVAIGHEFWMTPTRVGYHGSFPEAAPDAPDASGRPRGFFGQIEVESGQRREVPSAQAEQFYGHYHAAPDGSAVATDGEVTAEWLSIAPLRVPGGTARPAALEYRPVARHGWVRRGDQRVHPHPHWHAGGRLITFTACPQLDSELPARPGQHVDVDTYVCLLDLGGGAAG